MKMMEFAKVRESHSLPGFFEDHIGAKKTIVSGGVRYSACPSCGASSDESVKVSVRGDKWHCFACFKKGDIIDAASMFWGKSIQEAAQELSGSVLDLPLIRAPIAKLVLVPKDQGAINEMINLLLDYSAASSDGVSQYLASRAISQEITDDAVKRRLLIGLPCDPDECFRVLLDVVGRDLLIAAGAWKKDSHAPGIIYRPLIFVSADARGAEFRLIKKSERMSAKAIRYGEPSHFAWAGSDHEMVVEGAVDMLSAVALGTERSIIGLAGASNWHSGDEWVQNLGSKGHVLLALDADTSGDEQSKKLSALLSDSKRLHRRHTLPTGIKDLNDMLQSLSSHDQP